MGRLHLPTRRPSPRGHAAPFDRTGFAYPTLPTPYSPPVQPSAESILIRARVMAASTPRQPCTSSCKATWVRGPVEGENVFRLEFSSDISNLTFESYADMPEMGHGTSPVTITRVDARTIEVSDLWLIMAGRWVLHCKLAGLDQTMEVRL